MGILIKGIGGVGSFWTACLLACVVLIGPVSAQAQQPLETTEATEATAYIRTIEMLDRSGFSILLIERTFLNRIMIRAKKGETRREIVISEATGLVLRDILYEE